MQSTFHTEPMAWQCLEQPFGFEIRCGKNSLSKGSGGLAIFFSTVNSRILLTYNFSAGPLV